MHSTASPVTYYKTRRNNHTRIFDFRRLFSFFFCWRSCDTLPKILTPSRVVYDPSGVHPLLVLSTTNMTTDLYFVVPLT